MEEGASGKRKEHPTGAAARRSSRELRQVMAGRGAFLVQIDRGAVPRNMVSSADRPQDASNTWSGPFPALKSFNAGQDPRIDAKRDAKVQAKYDTMERKGFLVTSDIGCLIPFEQYRAGKDQGHQRSFEFHAGWKPDSTQVRKPVGPFGVTLSVNLEVSHLCHRHECVNPTHLVAEAKWKNAKRNYCGISQSPFQCDCGSVLKCLKFYESPDDKLIRPLCQSSDETTTTLASLTAAGYSWRVLTPETYSTRDESSLQRASKKQKLDEVGEEPEVDSQ